jgi:hypothetical protein
MIKLKNDKMIKFWNAIGGRKFLVLLLASGGLYIGKLDSWHWVIIAALYLGINVIQKFIPGIKE